MAKRRVMESSRALLWSILSLEGRRLKTLRAVWAASDTNKVDAEREAAAARAEKVSSKQYYVIFQLMSYTRAGVYLCVSVSVCVCFLCIRVQKDIVKL